MANDEKYWTKMREWIDLQLQSRNGYFLVENKILPGNQVKIFIDADSGASINELAKINKALRRQIDEEGWFPEGDYSLEVSSPGLDEPLKQWRQYKKNVGRKVALVLLNGQKKKGILKDVSEEYIILEYKLKNKKGKKAKADATEREPEQISFEEIKTTKVCVGF